MIKFLYKYILLPAIFTSGFLHAQYSENQYGLFLSANYTTTARLFLNPNSIQKVIREENIEVEGVYSGAIELRYRFNDDIMIGLGTEYVEHTSELRNVIGFPPTLAGLDVQEGFKMIPIEISGYYFVPFSTEDFKFYMGGGLGIYFGTYIRKVGSAEVENVSSEFSWGIHGRLGMDYMITDYFSVRGEMKFRDPEFENESKFTESAISYRGTVINLPQQPFPTKVNIDGMTFALGAVLHF